MNLLGLTFQRLAAQSRTLPTNGDRMAAITNQGKGGRSDI